jgi:hypothetical protein
MRAIFLLVIGGVCLVGCKHPAPKEPSQPAATAKPQTETKGAVPAETRKTTAPSPARATPVNEPTGKVASVNSNLRFVVIDFGLNPLPQTDQHLNVYRDGQKVGEVKVSSQARNNIVAADITAGDAKVGDEIRP